MTAHNSSVKRTEDDNLCAVITWWLRPVLLAFAPLIDSAYSHLESLRATIWREA
jgi:hypothetical protein